MLCARQNTNITHCDPFPFKLGNGQPLIYSIASLILGLHLLATQAMSYKIFHISLFDNPLVMLSEVSIHLSVTQMNILPKVMKLLQNKINEVINP